MDRQGNPSYGCLMHLIPCWSSLLFTRRSCRHANTVLLARQNRDGLCRKMSVGGYTESNKYTTDHTNWWTLLSAGQTLRVLLPGGSTFLREMTSWPHVECMTSNRKSDSVNRCEFTWRATLPNFIPMRFETTDTLAFLKTDAPMTRRKGTETTGDMRSVRDPKIRRCAIHITPERLPATYNLHVTVEMLYVAFLDWLTLYR